MVIDNTGSVEDIHAFIYCKKWRFGRVSRMPDRQTTLKDRATQLLIKYKIGALVTQINENSLDGNRVCPQVYPTYMPPKRFSETIWAVCAV